MRQDIGYFWLLSNGYRVIGAELVESAIEQLFAELAITPTISFVGDIKHYNAPNIDIFVGDIFELSSKILGPVDAIYDRAALIALPDETRTRYAAHLMAITLYGAAVTYCLSLRSKPYARSSIFN